MLEQALLLVLAFAFGIAIIALLEGFSSSFQNCIQLASGETTIRAHLHCTERFADAHNALITAVATFLLTIVTLGLILGAVDQQKTTRAQLRAYLLPERATIDRTTRR